MIKNEISAFGTWYLFADLKDAKKAIWCFNDYIDKTQSKARISNSSMIRTKYYYAEQTQNKGIRSWKGSVTWVNLMGIKVTTQNKGLWGWKGSYSTVKKGVFVQFFLSIHHAWNSFLHRISLIRIFVFLRCYPKSTEPLATSAVVHSVLVAHISPLHASLLGNDNCFETTLWYSWYSAISFLLEQYNDLSGLSPSYGGTDYHIRGAAR